MAALEILKGRHIGQDKVTEISTLVKTNGGTMTFQPCGLIEVSLGGEVYTYHY